MVDTVVLKVSKDSFEILPSVYRCFSSYIPSILNEKVSCARFAKAYYTPPEDLKRSGLYLPKFSVIKAKRYGGYEIFAHIEFSAPKLLFGNNFEEFIGDELHEVSKALSNHLKMMGILIRPSSIEQGKVATIHYGKNIPFTDYTTASQIISDLAKCDVTIRKQHNTRDFTNGGEALYFQTKTCGLVIYDKVRELKVSQSKCTRFEEDNQCQVHILDQIKNPFEVVRIEVRLSNRQIIRNTLNRCNLEFKEGRFCDLFSLNTAQAILLDAFVPFLAMQNKLLSTNSSFKELVVNLRRSNPNMALRNILMLVGLKALLSEIDFLEIRKIARATSGQWSRLNQFIREIKIGAQQQDSVALVEQHLKKFQPVKLKNYTTL